MAAVADEPAIEKNNETLKSFIFSPQLFRIVGRVSHVVAVRHKATAHLQVLHVKRSVAIRCSRAVCSRPSMLLVDEPTAQLDTRTSHSVSHVLGNLAGQGMIVLVATHDPDTRDACDRVIDLADYAPQVGGSTAQPANIAVH